MAKLKRNLRALNQLMRSEPLQKKVNKEADRISAKAGPKFQVHPSPHKYTSRAFVEPKEGVTTNDADRMALLRALN